MSEYKDVLLYFWHYPGTYGMEFQNSASHLLTGEDIKETLRNLGDVVRCLRCFIFLANLVWYNILQKLQIDIG